MGNQSMFMYGLGANLVMLAGAIVATFGIGLFFLTAYLAGGIIALIGFAIGIKGMAMRFDYKRQSGSIIHRGDW